MMRIYCKYFALIDTVGETREVETGCENLGFCEGVKSCVFKSGGVLCDGRNKWGVVIRR
jgi:hypothetical protein